VDVPAWIVRAANDHRRFRVRRFAPPCSKDPGRGHSRHREGRRERARTGSTKRQHRPQRYQKGRHGRRRGLYCRPSDRTTRRPNTPRLFASWIEKIRQNLSLTSETKTPAQWREGDVRRKGADD
jgi:hypothetical protein